MSSGEAVTGKYFFLFLEDFGRAFNYDMFRVLLVTWLWALVAVANRPPGSSKKCSACPPCDNRQLDFTCNCTCTPYSLPSATCPAPPPCPPCPTIPIPAISTTPSILSSGYVEQPRSIYKFVGCDPEGISWNDANNTCVKEGGNLAIPRTMLDVYMLVGMLTIQKETKDISCSVHVGFHDKDKDGVFHSVIGEPIAAMFAGSRWGKNQPDGGDGEDNVHCVTMDEKGYLGDEDCEEPNAFACQLKSD